MATLHAEIRQKRNIMREIYGGMMTAEDLHKELGMKPEAARQLMLDNGIGLVLGNRVKFETDMVAKFIVERRGFA
jgi:hypothetical protein